MLEFLGTGIIGSLFGGLFRLAPEVLKFFDKKNERNHELSMFRLQTDLEKQRGEFRVEERYVDHSVSQLEAIQEAFKEQRKTAESSYKWVAALSALVRPLITYLLFALYIVVKVTIMYSAYDSGIAWLEIAQNSWTVEDFGMLNMILTFWFVGRSIEKYERTTGR
jgi:hypothetical protein